MVRNAQRDQDPGFVYLLKGVPIQLCCRIFTLYITGILSNLYQHGIFSYSSITDIRTLLTIALPLQDSIKHLLDHELSKGRRGVQTHKHYFSLELLRLTILYETKLRLRLC